MSLNRCLIRHLCLRSNSPVLNFLGCYINVHRNVHDLKEKKAKHVSPWVHQRRLKEEEALKSSVDEPVDDTPVIIRYLQETKKVDNGQRETDEALAKEIIESSLKEMKYDIDALKFSPKVTETDADDINLKNDAGEIKVPRDILFGTPDPSVLPSDIPCGGCGAKLHCQDTAIPGFMPQEKFKGLRREDLQTQQCQRCTMLKDHNHLIHYGVDKQTYPQIVRNIRTEKALVVMVVDVTDMDNSVIKDYLKRVGARTPVYLVGNKIDLIPKDKRGYLNGIGKALIETCLKANLNPKENNIRHVCLVSAKTGYGIEDLVSKLMHDWGYKGNVYLVGTTNSGKSTLFNTFLRSDYCKSSVRDIMQRATVSQWPGTTLNLLKFPIINPKPWRLARRVNRLKKTKTTSAENERLRKEMLVKYGGSKHAIIGELVEKTEFRRPEEVLEEEKRNMPTGSTFATYNVGQQNDIAIRSQTPQEYSEAMRIVTDEHFPNSHWLFDTPGLVSEDQVITRLTADELRAVLPETLLRPRMFLLKKGQVMFVSGLARIDCLQGPYDMKVCVFTSLAIPIHVVSATEADNFYATHVGTDILGVPLGDENRLNKLPSLAGRDFSITNETNSKMATADIQLSSLGWISPLLCLGQSVQLRVYTPGGYGIHLRQPCLLPDLIVFKGQRMRGSFQYKMKKAIA